MTAFFTGGALALQIYVGSNRFGVESVVPNIVVLGIIIYALLGKLADVLTRQLERHALAWHPAYQIASAA